MSRRTRKQMVGKAAENEEIELRDEALEMLRRKLRRQPPVQRDEL